MAQRSILIVNDDVNSCKLFNVYCQKAGYHVQSVGSAEQALVLLASVHPDVIILDIELPGMDGITFLRKLKADPALSDIRVVVTTVYNELYDRKMVRKEGADDFLLVPAEQEQIMKLIANTLPKILQEC